MPEATHLSSAAVWARPEAADAVCARIATLPGCTVPARDGGRLVVLIEAADEHAMGDILNRITLTDGVLSAGLVFHAVDAGPDAPSEDIEGGTP